MTWGEFFQQTYAAASSTAQKAADATMSSARAAGQAVARVAQDAAARSAQLAEQGWSAAKVAAHTVADGAQAVGSGVSNVAGFGARAVGETAGVAADTVASAVAAPYKAARQMFSPTRPASATAVELCPASPEAKKERLEKRNQLIRDGARSPDPGQRAAAQRLARNNEAVELARLSDDAYKQYPGNDFHYPQDAPVCNADGSTSPPLGWSVVTKEELASKGVSVEGLESARAVVYRTPADWPGGSKTVLAFRGTADLQDGIVDHDQAMSLPTEQYKQAMLVGDQMSMAYGPNTVVTGHSLGGGKAQAAGVAGGLKGMMFNSAGLNPDTVGELETDPKAFTQYRTTGDPLTGAQNSAAVQTAIATVAGVVLTPFGAGMKLGDAGMKAAGFGGLSHEMADYADKAMKSFPRGMRNLVRQGNVMPPAVGAVREVPAIDASGAPVSRLDLGGQHSITSVVGGIEQQKTEDVATLSE